MMKSDEEERRPATKCLDFSWGGNVLPRLKGEWVLVRIYWWKVLAALFVLCYLCIVVFRNLAFLRHRTMSDYVKNGSADLESLRLDDLGFEVTPDWSDNGAAKAMNEAIQMMLLFSLLFTGLFPLVYARANERPYFFHVALRFFFAITTGHVLRPLFYLGTSLPGPALHCQGAEEARNQPVSAADVFLAAVPGANCGDLIFSGHMLMVTTAWMAQTHYTGRIFGTAASRAVLVVGGALIAVQAFVVIATRNHYTVDVVGGIVIGLFNWMWHQHVLRPEDLNPEDASVQALANEAFPCCRTPADAKGAATTGGPSLEMV